MPQSFVFNTVLTLWLILTIAFVLSQVVLFFHLQPLGLPKGQDHFSIHVHSSFDSSQYERSCRDLFGVDAIKKTHEGRCLEHSVLKWISCNIGPISIDTSKIEGALGGEPIQNVLNRKVEDEFLNFTTGSLHLLEHPLFEDLSSQVVDPIIASFLHSSVLTRPIGVQSISVGKMMSGTTLLVRRGSYANPCMAIISMYNVFVVQRLLVDNLEKRTKIIWLDGHAFNKNLDEVWEHLFQTKPIHVKQLSDSQSKMDNALVVNTVSAMGDEGLGIYGWETGVPGSTSDPALCSNSTLRMFRDFVFERYDINQRTKSVGVSSCRLTLLFRKHHFAHPRSTGRTDRVLANLTDDIDYIQAEYPDCKVTPASFEDISFQEQLKITSQSDVFVSVHGAGNIHVLFLPPHAKIVEFFPKGFTRRLRFQYLAECLGISYDARKAKIVERFDDNKISVRLRPQI
ncbi:unnamed protein product [Cylindrotheca closterium]|uniref:EGF domain-specific O-linked N-acetylglucosamine transferase n=1 Tax=Cylindrotheca closterium TaxID=2856 RepID=A0AAD2G3T6_9STRA|nr:unnamed protein product [Cylindrotheca closterium]